jgi:hypothetical protein
MKFILWFIIILLVIRMFRKSIFVSVYKSYDAQMKQQMRKQQQPSKPEGTVTIEQKNQSAQNKRSDGEFVDYEEVK